jgi:S-adenosylmethionine:tRNA-ribosyltransferase-isomerase (queuine synthetase)
MGGGATWRTAYAHAVAERFRFYSYGDAMLLLPAAAAARLGDGG